MSVKKIAEMAGVSPATVSRVLNDRPASAKPEVRDRIWAAARAIGYTPNENARKLRTGDRAQDARARVAVVLARIGSLGDDPFFAELYRAVEYELHRQGALMTQLIYARDTLPELDAPSGVLILGRSSEALLARLRRASDHIVGLSRNPNDFDMDEVVCDGEKAAALATEHLIGLGHKKIAYIGDCSYERRYVGYTQTLIGHRLPLDYELILQTDQTRASAVPAMRRLLKAGEATAVLCANDITAVGAIEAMRECTAAGRRPAIVSIDNIEEAQTTAPLLTTVNVPRRDMAHMAVAVLLDRIRGGHQEHVRVELPCRLVVRESDIFG